MKTKGFTLFFENKRRQSQQNGQLHILQLKKR